MIKKFPTRLFSAFSGQGIEPAHIGKAGIVRVGTVDSCTESKRQGRDLRISCQIASRAGFPQEVERLLNIVVLDFCELDDGLFKPAHDVRRRLRHGHRIGKHATAGRNPHKSEDRG